MSRKRTIFQALTLAALGLLALLSVLVQAPDAAHGQMARYGSINIQNSTEKTLFFSLLCPCGGCVRESLGFCLCATAHQLRAEVRGELAAGRTIEEIKAGYAGRFGTKHLAVPPNEGGHRLLYILPLAAIMAGAVLLIVVLRRWRRPTPAPSGAGAGGVATGKRDDYDDKLDEELKSLDRE